MNKFEELQKYYADCFAMMDCVHFNSDLTKQEYEKVLGEVPGKVISITHNGIKDRREKKVFSSKGLIVGFIGNSTPYKGLQVLCNAVSGLDIDVMVWGGKIEEQGRIHHRGKFSHEHLKSVYQEMDLLVVPSIWKETFSLVTLEALSFGIPVLVSDNVGAKDIVKRYAPEFVYQTEEDLRNLLAKLVKDKSSLIQYNDRILETPWEHDMRLHAQEIVEEIYKSELPSLF